MSQESVQPIQLLIQWLAGAIAFRRQGRLHILNGLVVGKYEAMRDVHQNFHSTLFEVESGLVEIERIILNRRDARPKMAELVRRIDEMDFKRSLTKAHRMELFYKSVPLATPRVYPFSGIVSPLNDEEWAMVRRFAESVCCYFGDTNEYCHDLGNVLNYTKGRLEMWARFKKAGHGDIQWALRDVRDALVRLTAKWAEISSRFADIENRLQYGLNFRLDRRPQHPVAHDLQPLEQADLFSTKASPDVRRLH